MLYKVLGDEGTEVDVLGTNYAVGAEVELDEAAAAPLVEAGTVAVVEATPPPAAE